MALDKIVLKGTRIESAREVKVMAVDTTMYDSLLQNVREEGGVAA